MKPMDLEQKLLERNLDAIDRTSSRLAQGAVRLRDGAWHIFLAGLVAVATLQARCECHITDKRLIVWGMVLALAVATASVMVSQAVWP